MKNSIFFFFFLIWINIITFSNEISDSKGIKIIQVKGQYINLTISTYGGKNIILNQLSDKNNPIINNKIIGDVLEYNLNNDKKNSFFKNRVKFSLLIPQNTEFKYIINTTNSSISIDGISGTIYVDNSNGRVVIDNLVGNLDIINSNRGIKLSNIVGNISVKSQFSRVTTKDTQGTLNIQTTHKKIKVENAQKIGVISTSNASILAEFKNITSDSKIVTSNNNLTIKIPENHNFNFSIFGDLVYVKNQFLKLKTDNFLILGTSNGTIKIENK